MTNVNDQENLGGILQSFNSEYQIAIVAGLDSEGMPIEVYITKNALGLTGNQVQDILLKGKTKKWNRVEKSKNFTKQDLCRIIIDTELDFLQINPCLISRIGDSWLIKGIKPV